MPKESEFTNQILTDYINDAIDRALFTDSLKVADIPLKHEKDELTNKDNYRPVSVLPLLSKVFERLIYDQLSEYLEKCLKTLLMCFSESSFHSTYSFQIFTSITWKIR